MYNPTPWQATSDCSSPNPGDCHWDLKVPTSCTGRCNGVVNGELNIGADAFSSNYTMIPLGMEPTLNEKNGNEDMFDEWLDPDRRVTWDPQSDGSWIPRYNPWNAPGSAAVFGNGCGVNGGNMDREYRGCNGGGKGIQLSVFYFFQTKILIY